MCKRSRNKRFRSGPSFATFIGALALILTSGSLSADWFGKDTPGERFRKAMKTREQMCASRKLVAGDTSCDILKLKPADPLETPEGRHAHSIRLPHQPATSVFVKGMTSEQYFSALCDRQAGEFILRTVKDVSGVMQMRPRQRATDYMMQHLYAMEDPFGSATEGDAAYSKLALVRPSRYRLIERQQGAQGAAIKVLKIIGEKPNYQKDSFEVLHEREGIEQSTRYGFTWRGLDVPNGREYGIAGSELIVIDTASGEVLAVRRGFMRTGGARNSFTGIWWFAGEICPKPTGRAEYYTYIFLTSVLKPVTPVGEANVK